MKTIPTLLLGATAACAALSVSAARAATIVDLFDTGVSGGLLPDGSIDPHWKVDGGPAFVYTHPAYHPDRGRAVHLAAGRTAATVTIPSTPTRLTFDLGPASISGLAELSGPSRRTTTRTVLSSTVTRSRQDTMQATKVRELPVADGLLDLGRIFPLGAEHPFVRGHRHRSARRPAGQRPAWHGVCGGARAGELGADDRRLRPGRRSPAPPPLGRRHRPDRNRLTTRRRRPQGWRRCSFRGYGDRAACADKPRPARVLRRPTRGRAVYGSSAPRSASRS